MTKKVKVSVSLDKDVLERADRAAREMGLSRSAWLSMLVAQATKRQGVTHQKA